MYVCADCISTIPDDQKKNRQPIDCRYGRWLKCKVCGIRRRMGYVITEREEK